MSTSMTVLLPGPSSPRAPQSSPGLWGASYINDNAATAATDNAAGASNVNKNDNDNAPFRPPGTTPQALQACMREKKS